MSFLKKDKRIVVLLVALAGLYVAILYLSIRFGYLWQCELLKYAAVCVCLLTAVLTYKYSIKQKDAKLLILALLFTSAADALFIFASAFPLGVATFMCVHLCYIRRYRQDLFKPFLILALIDILFCAAIAVFGLKLPYIYMLAGVYGLLIFATTYLAFHSSLPRINKRLVCIGMILFILCDTNVTIIFFAPVSSLDAISNVLVWLFYIPSQACLALSAVKYESVGIN